MHDVENSPKPQGDGGVPSQEVPAAGVLGGEPALQCLRGSSAPPSIVVPFQWIGDGTHGTGRADGYRPSALGLDSPGVAKAVLTPGQAAQDPVGFPLV